MLILLSYLFFGAAATFAGWKLCQPAAKAEPMERAPPSRSRRVKTFGRYAGGAILIVYGASLLCGGLTMLLMGFDPWNPGS